MTLRRSARPGLRLLVTGVTGLLGVGLVRQGLDRYEIWGIARRPTAVPLPCHVAVADLVDGAAVARAVEQIRPDAVIHAAAQASVDQCESDPSAAIAVNVGGTKNLLRALRGHACRFVLISTDAVFDGSRGDWTEEDPPGPVHVYGRTKLLAEEAVLADRPEALVVRTSFYGWNSLPKESLAEWILGRLRAGESVPGFVDLRFSPLLTDHLARVLYELVPTPVAGVLHVASSDGCSKFDFARQVVAAFGFPASRVIPATSTAAGLVARRPRDLTLSSARAAGVLDRALPTVADGLAAFFDLEAAGAGVTAGGGRPA